MQAEVEFHRRCRESAEMAKLEMISAEKPTLQEPARLEWHEVTKMAHYYLSVNAMTRPDLPAGRQVQVREDEAPYGKRGQE